MFFSEKEKNQISGHTEGKCDILLTVTMAEQEPEPELFDMVSL